MAQIEITQRINAPVGKVFPLIADVSKKAAWGKQIHSARALPQNGAGDKSYEVISMPFGKEAKEIYKVSKLDKDREVSFDVAVVGQQSRQESYYFSNDGETTTIKLVVQIQPKGIFQKFLLSRGLIVGYKLLLNDFQKYAESTQ